MDNVIQVQEAMHSSFHRKEKGMLMKLDMANAFGRVKLSFLYSVLHSFGFSHAFINLIKAFIYKPWIASLVNGIPSNFFKLPVVFDRVVLSRRFCIFLWLIL